MRLKTLCASLALALTAGCASITDPMRWDVQPVLDVRHGMTQASAYYRLGRYYQGQRRIAEAQQAYEKAVLADARHVDALNALGALHARRGDLASALDTFKRVETLAPELAYLHNNMGYTLYLQGRHAEAIAAFRRALAIDPGYARAWTNIERAAEAAGDAGLVAWARRRGMGDGVVVAALPEREPPVVLKSATALGGVPAAAPITIGATPLRVALPGTPAPTPMRVSLHGAAASGKAVLHRMATLSVPDAVPPPPPTAFRLEISNGNGVRHFATRFSAMLRRLGQPVARITNHRDFTLEHTVIAYRAGFAGAAAAVDRRFALGATLQAVEGERSGTDVRVILGRDMAARGIESIQAAADETSPSA